MTPRPLFPLGFLGSSQIASGSGTRTGLSEAADRRRRRRRPEGEGDRLPEERRDEEPGPLRLPFLPRRQLPAHSPVSFRGVRGAFSEALGRKTEALEWLEERLKRDFNATRVVLCDSGTSSLQLALSAADRAGSGPNVVALPAFTCFEVASAAIGAGAHIALYDVDPETLAPDPESLEAALRDGVKTLVVCPLFGIPIDWSPVRALARRYSVTVVEDAAQGHGATSGGRPVGGNGPLSVLSFGRGKGWSGGRGGALMSIDDQDVPPLLPSDGLPELDRLPGRGQARELRVVGESFVQWALGRPDRYSLPASLPWLALGETHYHPPSPPGAMTAASAALLRASREAALEEAAVRSRHARLYDRDLPENSAVRPIRLPGAPGVAAGRIDPQPGFLRFPVRLTGGLSSLTDARRARHLGIESGYPSTLAALEPVRARLWRRGLRFPGAEALAAELVTLPTHSLVTLQDREAILDLLEEHSETA